MTMTRRAQMTFLLTMLGVAALVSGPHAQGVQLTSIAPASASYGESVTVTGAGFGGPGVEVRVGGVLAQVVSATGSRVVFRVPVGVPVGPATVIVTNPGRRTASMPFDVSGRVSLTFDEPQRVEAIVGPDGGVISTESNGRTFRLTIPPGALAAPETIVLTPVADIFGFPLERSLGTLHFAPEGLQFLRPATLTITLPPGTDTKGLIGISAAGNGENLHLAPFTIADDGAISVAIPHFTLGGLGGATLATINSIFCAEPTIECRYVNALSRAQAQAIQSVCGANCTAADLIDHMAAIEDAVGAAYIPLIGQWFDEVLTLINTTGEANDEGLNTARREYLAWYAYLQASSCSSTTDCIAIGSLAADVQEGERALARAYAAAFQRAENDCSDRRVFNLMTQVQYLALLNTDPLPADLDGIREEFGCELVIVPSFPALVNFNDVVPFSVAIAVRNVGAAPDLVTWLEITDGCGEFAGGGRFKSVVTDANGMIATTVKVGNPCNGAQNATEIRVTVPNDIQDAAGEVAVLARKATVRASMEIEIVVTPQNASVNPGGVITFTAQVSGAGPLVRWTASGGTITPGPSATATYTAGSAPGGFSVTATSVDVPTESQTVAVIVEGGGDPEVIVRPLTANLKTEAAGGCKVEFDPFFGFDSSCPANTREAPPGFTGFGEQQTLFTTFGENQGGNVARAEHYVSIGGGEIRSSGLTNAATGGRLVWDPETEQYVVDFPSSHAAGTAELRVEIEVRGQPVEYQLDGRFFHDNYAFWSALGHSHVKLEFADYIRDFSIENAGSMVTIPTVSGTLQPGTYTLKFTAEAEAVKNVSGGIGHSTRWSFRLRIR